jgi:hypothetical protein
MSTLRDYMQPQVSEVCATSRLFGREGANISVAAVRRPGLEVGKLCGGILLDYKWPVPVALQRQHGRVRMEACAKLYMVHDNCSSCINPHARRGAHVLG